MSLTKDGFYKSFSGAIGNNNYLLEAGGGHIGWGNSANQIPYSNGAINTNLNADMIDGYHKTDLIGELTRGSWNPRGTNLAMDWYYNGGDMSISESGGQISVSVDGYFYQNEGQYKVLDENNYTSYTDYRYLSKISNDSTPYQYSFTKTDDHAIQVGTIRGRSVGSQSGEFIHLYERVAIGSPNGWGSRPAPSYGLATYGGAWLATDTGNVGIGTTSPSQKLHVEGNELVSGTSLMAYSIKILPSVYSELKTSYGLSSDYESRYNTEEFLQSWVKYAYANGAGYTVQSYISPNSRGFIIADVYASGINSSTGYPEHITGRYYPYGGGEIIFGTSYGSWYYRTGYDDSYHPNTDYVYVEATSTSDWMYPNFTYYGNTYRREYVYTKLRFQPSTGHLLINGAFDNCPTKYDDGNDRPGISITGSYPQLSLISNVSNSSHGPVLSIGAYDSAGANSGGFKTFRLGTRGYDATWLDLSYGTHANVHEGIDGWNPSGNGLQITRFHNDRTIYNYGTVYFGVASYGATYYHSGYTVYSYNKISYYSYTYNKAIIGSSSMWNHTLGVNGDVGIATDSKANGGYLHIAENTFAIDFRPGNGSYGTGFTYGSYGNEYLALLTEQSVTSIIFGNGYNPEIALVGSFISNDSNYNYGSSSDVIQIKQNCMNIGDVWRSGTSPDYKLKVNGNSKFTDTIYTANDYYNTLGGSNSGIGALHLNNSDITGVNAISTNDLSENWLESLAFSRSNGNWDTFRAADGMFYFGVNNGTEKVFIRSERMSTTGGMPYYFQYGTGMTGTCIWANGISFRDPYNNDPTNNDSGWIRHLETSGNSGSLEIATGDDSDEIIYIRHYNTSNTVSYESYFRYGKLYGGGYYHLSYGSSDYFLTSDGDAKHWSWLDNYYLRLFRRINSNGASTNSGTIPPSILEFKNGYPLHPDPEFAYGSNDMYTYDNNGSGNTYITRETNSTCGNSTGYVIKVTSGSGATPGYGGWYFGDMTRANTDMTCIFRALIPSGVSVEWSSNSIGSGGTGYWLTEHIGTGKWEWYAYHVKGGTGSLSSTNFYYVTTACTWYISFANTYINTYGAWDGNARYVIGDNISSNPIGALLQSGWGRNDNSPGGDTWIFLDTLGGTSSPWGFRHNQANNSIGFIGAGTEWSRIPLYSGISGYIGSALTVGANVDPSQTLDVRGNIVLGNSTGETHIYARTSSFNNPALSFYDDTSGFGIMSVLGGGGCTVVGGGESAHEFAPYVRDENLYLTADQNVNIFTNLDGGYGSRRHVAHFNTNGDTYLYGNLYLGANESNNFIAFYGNTGDAPGSYVTTFIGEHLWGGGESTELLFMKFNDVGNGTDGTTAYSSGPDRIRHLAHAHVFQIMTDTSQNDFVTMANSSAVETKFDIARYRINAYVPLHITGYINLNDHGYLMSGRSTSFNYGYSLSLGDSSQSMGMFSGPGGEEGAVIVSPDTCVIYNSFDQGWGFQVFDKDRGGDLTTDNSRVFGVNQANYFTWSRGGFWKEGSNNDYVLLGGGGHAYWPNLYDGRYLRYEGWWNDGSGQNVDDSLGMTFTYTSHGSPHHWGTTVTFESSRGSSYRLQLHGTGDNYLYFRNRSSDYGGWHSSGWKQILTNQDTYVSGDKGVINGSWIYALQSLGNKSASDRSSTYPTGLSTHGIYNNGYPFTYGCGITAYSNGGAFQIAGQWNSDITGDSNCNFPTEMYIRGRRDSYDTWSTWTRVVTDRNIGNFYWANVTVSTSSNTSTNPQFNSVNVGGTSTGYGAYLASGKRLYIEGTESNAIYTEHHANSHISTNSPESGAAIRHGFVFKWYDTYWKIGNVRGGSFNSAGFGIAYYGGSQLQLLVRPSSKTWIYYGIHSFASSQSWTNNPESGNNGISIKSINGGGVMTPYIHFIPNNISKAWRFATYYTGSGYGYENNLILYQGYTSGSNNTTLAEYIFRGQSYGSQGKSYVATCEGNSYNLVVIGVFTLSRSSPSNTSYTVYQVHGLITPVIINQVRNEWLGSHHTSDGGMIIRMDMRSGYENYTTKTTINIVSAYGVITETWWGRKYVGLSRDDVDAFCGSLGSFDIATFASQPSQFTNNDYYYSQTNGVNTTGRYLMITNRTIAGWSSNGGIGRMSFAGLYGNRDGACITFKVTCFGYLS